MSIVREVTIGDCRLIQGDCLEVLPTLDDGCADALITDPPFGIKFKYESHNDTPEGYGEWLWSIIEMAESKCTDGAACFVWQAMKNVRRFAEWFPREWRLFSACKNFVQMRPTEMQYAVDPIVVWWKEGERWAAGTASRDYHVANTSPSCRAVGAIDYVDGHPCPRPLGQVSHIIEQWVKPGATVIDCFMGSGTAGAACARLGRAFIGIEKEPKYFDIAVRRIEQAYADQALFAGASQC